MEIKDWYVEYATGSVSNRNQVCKISDFSKIAKTAAGSEIYRSMFLYDETIVNHLKENKTVM